MAETCSKFACVLALVAVIIATLSPTGLQVLCVGEDGHRAIEVAHQFAACETATAADHTPLDHHDGLRAERSGCTDFGLGLDIDARPARVHDDLLATLSFPPLLVYSPDTDGTLSAGLKYRPAMFEQITPPGSTQTLRTTVLLL